MEISLAEWARRQDVTPERARQWARQERIKARCIEKRLWLIDEGEPRPEPQRPGPKKKTE